MPLKGLGGIDANSVNLYAFCMSEEHKDRVRAAMEGFIAKQKAKQAGPTRKNAKPEKKVEAAHLIWFKENLFDVDVIEGKAVFNASEGRYLRGQVIPGFSDIAGNDQFGHAVYVELKAPGRVSALRDEQYDFLMRKIYSNCFAIVSDNANRTAILYRHWLELPSMESRREFLLKNLPKKKPVDDRPLFED